MIASQTASQIDHELAQRYDGSGTFELSFMCVPGMNEKIAADVVKQYKTAGWRGTKFEFDGLKRSVVFRLSVREN